MYACLCYCHPHSAQCVQGTDRSLLLECDWLLYRQLDTDHLLAISHRYCITQHCLCYTEWGHWLDNRGSNTQQNIPSFSKQGDQARHKPMWPSCHTNTLTNHCAIPPQKIRSWDVYHRIADIQVLFSVWFGILSIPSFSPPQIPRIANHSKVTNDFELQTTT